MQGSTIMLDIDGIAEFSDRGGVQVILKGGKRMWVPGEHCEWLPGAVCVPEWLIKKMRNAPRLNTPKGTPVQRGKERGMQKEKANAHV